MFCQFLVSWQQLKRNSSNMICLCWQYHLNIPVVFSSSIWLSPKNIYSSSKLFPVESVSKNIRVLDTIHCAVNPGSVQPEILANLMKEVNASDSFAPYIFILRMCVYITCMYIYSNIYLYMYVHDKHNVQTISRIPCRDLVIQIVWYYVYLYHIIISP